MATSNQTNTPSFARRSKPAKEEKKAAPPVAEKKAVQVAPPVADRDPSARKAPVTHKDLMIAYLIEGIDGINPLLADHSDAVAVLDRMIGNLEGKGQNTDELSSLRAFYQEIADSPGSPGRKQVRIGDTREYTVQQVGNEGDLFMRVPLGTLGSVRGEKVLAAFEDGKITISKV